MARRATQTKDWRAVLERATTDVGESGTYQLSAICPLCNHHRVSLYVHKYKGLWSCHYCGRKGTGYQLLKALRELGLISKDVAPPAPDFGVEPVVPHVEIKLPPEFESLMLPETVGNKRFWNYAFKRHLAPELVEEYGVGFCRRGYYAGRLIVPAYHQGELISFVARAIGPSPKKIVTPPGNKQSEHLFNLDQLGGCKKVVIVEGVFDCLVIPGIAVASFGKRLTDAQVALLVAAGFKQVIICWDADAHREAEDAALRLSWLIPTRVVSLAEGDPSDLGPERTLEVLLSAATSSPSKRISAGVKNIGGKYV